jgi:4-hydroxy-tetrahydrodipicolinate reductase
MNIALIGYGKMGKEIEMIAIGRGHKVSLIIDIDNYHDLTVENLIQCDAAIEFTTPASAIENYLICFEAGIPVISGTTGWLSKRKEIEEACLKVDGTFFYASNFSIGVNLFFRLNGMLAKLMASQPAYTVGMTEIHHMQKLDSPSGTAITLAEQLTGILPGKKKWINQGEPEEDEILIKSERTGSVPGTHVVRYESEADYIEITHCAKNRKGFALGVVLAAEFCLTNKGLLSMNDMFKL